MDEKEPASVSSSRVDWLALQSVDRTQRAGHLTNLLLPTVEWTPGGGIDIRNFYNHFNFSGNVSSTNHGQQTQQTIASRRRAVAAPTVTPMATVSLVWRGILDSPSSTFIHYHSLSPTIIHYQPLSSTMAMSSPPDEKPPL